MSDWDEFSKGCPWEDSAGRCIVMESGAKFNAKFNAKCKQSHCAPYHFAYQMMITTAIKFETVEVPKVDKE